MTDTNTVTTKGRSYTTPGDSPPTPAEIMESSELSREVTQALHRSLTPHQRRVALALLVDGVPIDVLAERLGTNRNALYKTLHDARRRLRADLTDRGFLEAPVTRRVRR